MTERWQHGGHEVGVATTNGAVCGRDVSTGMPAAFAHDDVDAHPAPSCPT